MGGIVLGKYLGQILRGQSVAGFRWDCWGGVSPPFYFRTTSPSAVHHCIVPRWVYRVLQWVSAYQEAGGWDSFSPQWAFLSTLGQAFYSAVLCYRRGVGAPPIHLHPSIQLCGCTPIFGLSSLAATAKCDSLTEWQRGVIGRGQLVRLCPPSLLANDKYPPPLSHTIITRA